MSGPKLLLDTNIALYLLGGDQILSSLLEEREVFLSFISEMELLAYPNITVLETSHIRYFLQDCQIIELNTDIKNIAIDLRKAYGLKLPDAIVAASAFHANIPLISADKIFQRVSEINFVLYKAL